MKLPEGIIGVCECCDARIATEEKWRFAHDDEGDTCGMVCEKCVALLGNDGSGN